MPDEEIPSPRKTPSTSRFRPDAVTDTATHSREELPALPPPKHGLFLSVLAALSIAAPFLGGATALWARASLAVFTGFLLLFKPPSRSLGWTFNLPAVLLVLVASTAFLPAGLWLGDHWRERLLAIPGLDLPWTRSPQPWQTAEALGLMLLGLAWAYYLLSHIWDHRNLTRVLRVFCSGVVLLAALALVSYFTKQKVPFWPTTGNSSANFGFFPNRNQTANVLALGGIMINALAFAEFRAARRKTSAFWFVCLALICGALFVAYSRSGILLFFGGVAIWALFSIRFSSSTKAVAITVSGAILLLTVLFLFGGETYQRFQGQTGAIHQDFRLLIQRDAWKLTAEAPWFGHGLGNFEPLFAMAREVSKTPERAPHPESDWMWAASELGWIAPLLLLGVFAVWLKRCFPFERDIISLLRSAAFVAGIGFVLHGFVDVSGHRLGSLWPALFLMSIALNPGWERASTWWMKPLFRILGLALIATGGMWFASLSLPWPTSAYAQRLNVEIEKHITANDARGVIDTTTKALIFAPLDWNLYNQRARALAVTYSTNDADRDFAIARTLEPNFAEFCYDEGLLWFELEQPDRGLDAWDEALKRPSNNPVGMFRRMLSATSRRPESRDILRIWAHANRSFLLTYLETSSKLEFELESERMLAEDPSLATLSPDERQQFLKIWAGRRELYRLGPLLLSKPEWYQDSWSLIARYYAEQGDFQKACVTVKQFAAIPPPPTIDKGEDLPKLEREFQLHPNDVVNGLALFGAQLRAEQPLAAAATLRELIKEKTAPRYVHILDFNLQMKLNEWEKAWHAWLAYESAPK